MAINEYNTCDNTWMEKQRILKFRRVMNLENINIAIIPRDWNALTDKLATQGRNAHILCL